MVDRVFLVAMLLCPLLVLDYLDVVRDREFFGWSGLFLGGRLITILWNGFLERTGVSPLQRLGRRHLLEIALQIFHGRGIFVFFPARRLLAFHRLLDSFVCGLLLLGLGVDWWRVVFLFPLQVAVIDRFAVEEVIFGDFSLLELGDGHLEIGVLIDRRKRLAEARGTIEAFLAAAWLAAIPPGFPAATETAAPVFSPLLEPRPLIIARLFSALRGIASAASSVAPVHAVELLDVFGLRGAL